MSPSRGLSDPRIPPDSVSLESRPESASLEESINPLSSADPLKSQQLLHSSSSFSSVQLNTNESTTNNSNSSCSCVIVQQTPPPSTTDQYHSNRIKDPNIRNDLSSQMTIDVSGPPLASFLQNESSTSFRSPNVLVTDPLYIVPPPPNVGVSLSSSSPSVSPSVSSAMVLSAIVSQQPPGVGGGKRKNSSQSSPSGHNLVSVPFPFTSMQHAMHTKQGNSNHPRSTPPHHHHPHLVVSPPDKSHHEVDSRSRSVDTTLVPSSRMTLSSCSSIGPVVATSSSSISTNRSGSLSEVSHTAAAKSASSNVALTSPLLVNLLQNESSQITTTTESKSSLKLSSSSSSTKMNMNWNDQRTANDPSSDHQSSSVSSSARSTSSSGLPKQQHSPDLNPINDLRVMIPATTLSVTSSSAPSSSEPSVSAQVVTRREFKTVPSSTCNSRNDISVRSSRHTNAENAPTSHSVNDMVLLTTATDDRNGTVHHDEEENMDQDLNNHDRRDANSLVNDTDIGRRVDQETNNTRNDILKHLINCHPSSTSGGNNASSSSNHGTESLERIPVPSHKTTDGNNAHNQQPSVNGKYDVLSEDEDDDDDGIIGDEEVLDVDLDDEMSDLPPLEPADMAMDIDDDCDSSELCNTSTTPNILNCVFEEAVSLGSLDGRQVYSVASGDHNYISVKIESDAICRSNSAHSDHREMDLMNETSGGVDPSLQHPTSHHSDLELRPNFNKCSNEDSVKKQKIKSEKDDTVNESGSSSQNKHPVTGHHHPESSTAMVETIVTTNNCHSKRREDSSLDTGGNSRNKLLHCDKVATKKNQSGVSKKLLSADKPDSPSGLERKGEFLIIGKRLVY